MRFHLDDFNEKLFMIFCVLPPEIICMWKRVHINLKNFFENKEWKVFLAGFVIGK